MTVSINQIHVDSVLTITDVNNLTLCFSDGVLLPLSDYVIENNGLVLSQEAFDNVSYYYNYGSGQTWEFSKVLKNYNTTVSGIDVYGNFLNDLNKITDTLMVFVNGILLTPEQFEITSATEILIKLDYPTGQINKIKIIKQPGLKYKGVITAITSDTHETLINYNYHTTLIFLNGEKVSFQNISILTNPLTGEAETCQINVPLSSGDRLEYYELPPTFQSLHFVGQPGFVTYDQFDFYKHKVSETYSATVTFSTMASLLVDDLRPGFFIKQVDGPGCLIITSTDFDKPTLTCVTLNKFTNSVLQPSEYFLQVPDCKSIVDYLSPWDQQFQLLPEVLAVLQETILNEVYDEIKRIKNIRSLTKVDSININKLIKFLGFNMNIYKLPLSKRREILQELNDFYDIVGTRDSYNFFNIIENSFGLSNLEQLFTYHDSGDTNKREYVDFFTKEDCGAIHIGPIWVVDATDYGTVDIEATSSEDRGLITETQDVEGVDCFYVTDPIDGEWKEWWEWDRPHNCYPTNHVNAELTIAPGVDSETTLTDFKTKFYDLASAVLYLHNIIQVYDVGGGTREIDGERQVGSVQDTGQVPCIGVLTAPVVNYQYYSTYNDIIFTADRKYYINNRPSVTVTIQPIPSEATVVLTAEGATQVGNAITVLRDSPIYYTVSCQGYMPKTGSINALETETIQVELQEV